jgi:TonB family protein
MAENRKEWEGQVVDGRFPLLQYLGGGEQSAVFATATGDQTLPNAAIKLVQADPDDAEIQLVRWQSAARLSHPHLMPLFHAGRCQLDGAELIYFVMDRADEDLSQVLLHRPLSAAEVLDVLGPALDALAYVHAQGLVHGRVRPSNILAVGDQLKLSSDRLCPAGEPRRRPGELDAYDAPETAGAGITPAADVWSLGVTVVEALTQRAEATLPPGLPAPFPDLLRGCLERDPGPRWTVAQIQARLRPPAKPQRTGTRWRYGALAAALVVAAAIVVGPRLVRREAAPAQKQASAAPKAEESTRIAPAPLPTRYSGPGSVLKQVPPDVPAKARDSIRGTVRVAVKVRVSSGGRVTDAELAAPGPSPYFARLALAAARQWTFMPPMADGQPLTSEWLVRFEFDRRTVKMQLAERLGPK